MLDGGAALIIPRPSHVYAMHGHPSRRLVPPDPARPRQPGTGQAASPLPAQAPECAGTEHCDRPPPPHPRVWAPRHSSSASSGSLHRAASLSRGAAVQGPRIVAEALEGHPAMDSLPEGAPHVIGGIASGVAGSTLSQPFDTIKVRMQAFVDKDHPKHSRYNSLAKATATILREDGALAFFHGLAPRAFRIICAPPQRCTCRPGSSAAGAASSADFQ